AHAAAAAKKPRPNSDVARKREYVRAKYQWRAFNPDGDGKLTRSGTTAASVSHGDQEQACARVCGHELVCSSVVFNMGREVVWW
ncbi:MAG: hypothetical protein SGPRY_009398, partial [Prymnesium sp.]